MNEYLRFLMEQYKQTKGLKWADSKSDLYMLELAGWLKERHQDSKYYLQLLRDMGLSNFYESNFAEVGKGAFDSSFSEFETTIITPFYKNIPDLRRVIKGRFGVYDGTPFVKNGKKVIYLNEPMTFMTQNPYTDFSGFESLDSFIVGVFGKTSDFDFKPKVKMLDDFKDRFDYTKCEYTTFGDTYVYAVSNDSQKEYTKTQKRKLR